MTITDRDRESMKTYRISQAHDAIDEVELLIENDRLKLAVNRIYYGMFYILSALALVYEFKTSKHQGIISWFNKEFIKGNKVDKKYAGILKRAFKNRSDCDYELFVEFSKPDVLEMYEEMKDFISTIETYIMENTPNVAESC